MIFVIYEGSFMEAFVIIYDSVEWFYQKRRIYRLINQCLSKLFKLIQYSLCFYHSL